MKILNLIYRKKELKWGCDILDICMVSSETFPTPPIGYWGGVERVVWDLSCALSELGHNVSLVARPGSKAPPNGTLFETYPDNDQEIIDACERHFDFYKEFVSSFDGIVHDHSVGKLVRKVSPYHVQTPHYCQDPRSMEFKNIIAASRAQAIWIQQFMPDGRLVPVVHHGINLDRYPYNGNKQDYYLFLSMLSEYKGALTALEIAKKTGVEMVFAGIPGGAHNIIEDTAKSFQNITYLGEVGEDKKQELMANAKALIFPTGNFGTGGGFGPDDWMEIFGLVQLEALSSGTPVITTNNGACPEIIKHGHTGFICISKEDMELKVQSGAIDAINPQACRDDAEARFSSKRMAEEYIQHYTKILSGELI